MLVNNETNNVRRISIYFWVNSYLNVVEFQVEKYSPNSFRPHYFENFRVM